MGFRDYSTTPSANETIGEDTYIGPNMARNDVRPALQQLAADGADLYEEVQTALDPAAGLKGEPGANVMAIGLFGAGATSTIPTGTDLVRTAGHSSKGIGIADYVYDADIDASYVTLFPRTSFISANGRGFRLSTEQRLTAPMFGIIPDDDAAQTKILNASRLKGMLDFLRLNATPAPGGGTQSAGTSKVHWPKGDYYFGDPATTTGYFSIKSVVHFEGESTGTGGAPQGSPASRLIFAKGGFRLENYQTLDGAAEGVATTGADGSIFRHLYMTSTQARPSAANYTADATSGIYALTRSVVEHCWCEEFTRDGWSIQSGAVSGVANVNANCSVGLYNTFQRNGRAGIGIDLDAEGGDSNAGVFIGNKTDFNGTWGHHDRSFLGNYVFGPHAAGNGNAPGAFTKHDGKTSTVTYPAVAGTTYYANPATDAATLMATTPGTNAAVWVPMIEGAGAAVPSTESPLWTATDSYKIGGSYFYDGTGTAGWFDTYSEAGQGQPWMGTHGSLIGGTWERNPNSGGAFVRMDGGRGGYTVFGTLNTDALQVNPTTAQPTLYLRGAAGYNFPAVRYYPNAAGSGPSSVGTPTALINNAPEHYFYDVTQSTAWASIKSDGVDILNSGSLKVAGTKVIGVRKTGWSTATGTATRTAFDTTTVTLPQLAERVKALIDDLHATAGHGVIGA